MDNYNQSRRSPTNPAERKRAHRHDGDEREVRRRSRSPRNREHDDKSTKRRRHHHHHHHHHHHRSVPVPDPVPVPTLPFNARTLSRSADYKAFRPLFAQYLDLQKQIDIRNIEEREVRGRWKSFVNKWNGGTLAEGWYDPVTFENAVLDQGQDVDEEKEEEEVESPDDDGHRVVVGQDLQIIHHHHHHHHNIISSRRASPDDDEDEDEDDDEYGPTLPGQKAAYSSFPSKHGPGIPSLTDLTLRRELEASGREEARDALRQERKFDRTLQKERLEEIVPRADAGTQARRLEKRREVRDANASFADAKSSNDVSEVPDADLLGDGGGGGLEEYKRLKRDQERKKTEREIRREEIMRAKQEEREERIRKYKEREEHTVDMLREIAKSRFG
ncbi:hypothetical protein GGS20DRAFT_579398 [Poronia punctata]|nr:hypothetical protein GGS20DRAFT_579398 [Poronia punctata]